MGEQALELTDEEWSMLSEIREAGRYGRGKRVPKSGARDRLKRLGLIASRPPNSGYIRAIGGHGNMWNATEAGRAALDARATAA